jgi:septal ring factor EnvC (AmiA/AmiB activator)
MEVENRLAKLEERDEVILEKFADMDKRVSIFEKTFEKTVVAFTETQKEFSETLKNMQKTLCDININMLNMENKLGNLGDKIDKVDKSVEKVNDETNTRITILDEKVDSNDEKGKIDIMVELKKHWLAIALGIIALLSNVDKIKMALKIP